MSIEEEGLIKAKTLVEALPYIKRFAGHTIVVKYGGSLITKRKLINTVASDIALLRYVGIKPVIVHGGGTEIEKWLKKFGKEPPRMIEGQPYTDAETLEITDMVLSGNVSNFIVTSLTEQGIKAVGLSGRDAQLFTTRRIKSETQKNLGYVGEIESTDVTIINKLSADNYVPVISSVGLSRDGTVLNVESDFVAATIASRLKATKLLYLASSDGITVDGKLQEFMDLVDAEQFIRSQDNNSGLTLKLQATINALKGGVTDVHIINGNTEHSVLLEIFTVKGIGTMISNQKMKV